MEDIKNLPYKWVPTSGSNIPDKAFVAGTNANGEPLYVGRAKHHNDLIPGKVDLQNGVCYVGCDWKEHGYAHYEVLVPDDNCKFVWMEEHNGRICEGAVRGGQTNYNHELYVGRTMHNGEIALGKVQPGHTTFYFPSNGREINSAHHEVLALDPALLPSAAYGWVPTSGSNIPDNAFVGGLDANGEPLYIGRVSARNQVRPGKVDLQKGVCIVGCDWRTFEHSEYEILVADDPSRLSWQEGRDGSRPATCVNFGKNSHVHNCYVGRATHMGVLTMGYVETPHKVIYLPVNDWVIAHPSYEILTLDHVAPS